MTFNRNQPRDEDGKWTDGIPGGGAVTDGPMGPLKAVKLTGVGWRDEKGQVRGFNSPDYGVKRADGKFLSSDGVKPWSFSRKRTADEVANTLLEGDNKWITPVSLTGGKQTDQPVKPPTQTSKTFDINVAKQSISPRKASTPTPTGRSVADKILDTLIAEDESRRRNKRLMAYLKENQGHEMLRRLFEP